MKQPGVNRAQYSSSHCICHVLEELFCCHQNLFVSLIIIDCCALTSFHGSCDQDGMRHPQTSTPDFSSRSSARVLQNAALGCLDLTVLQQPGYEAIEGYVFILTSQFTVSGPASTLKL